MKARRRGAHLVHCWAVARGAGLERVVGRYALYGELASGGMATVHLGRLLGPVGFAKTVAVKRLHAHFAKDPEFVSMFLDEARLAARIQHPNVVATLDVVSLAEELFLVMEYVQGETLSKILKEMRGRGERPPVRIASSLISGALLGLHAAHEAKSERGRPLGIVHRDVSPQNIMIGVDGVPKVLDFGVAKAAGRVQHTKDGQLKGKLAYMPPEQLRGAAMDRRTDIYAASVVLWEMLAGARLFDGESEAQIFAKVLEGQVEPPSKFNPEVSPALDAAVLKGLVKDPDQRYATARDMAVALEDAVPLMSPRQISEWVEIHAGKSLAAKAERIKEIETVTSISMPPTGGESHDESVHGIEDVSDEAEEEEGTLATGGAASRPHLGAVGFEPGSLSKVSSLSLSSRAGSPRNATFFASFAAGLLAVGGIVGFFTLRGHTGESQSGQQPQVQQAPVTQAAVPAPQAAPKPIATPAPAPAAPAEPGETLDIDAQAPAPPAPAAAQTTKPVTAVTKPRSGPSAGATQGTTVQSQPVTAAKPAAALNCNPPFTFGADGIKRVKKGCN